MKYLRNKIGWFLVLIVVVAGAMIVSNKVNFTALSADNSSSFKYTSLANDYYDTTVVSNFEDVDFGAVIFVELFVTIHMSLFVFIPLAKAISPTKHKTLFKIFFYLRFMLLIYGDIMRPGFTMFADFIFVFIGGFFIVPIASFLSEIFHRKGSADVDEEKQLLTTNDEVGDLELANIGFGDREVLKRGLVEQYRYILSYYEGRNFRELVKLCSPGIYSNFKNEVELYDKTSEKLVIKDFNCSDAKLVKAEKQGQQLFINLRIVYKCLEYVTDGYDNVVRGSNVVPKENTKLLTFSKKLASNIVTKCPNCNASVDEDDVEFCSYCGTVINFTGGNWILKKEVTLSEK